MTVLQKLLVSAALASIATAQTLLPASAGNGFPQCAYSCSTLEQAAQSCLADPSHQQSIITSCFCQSSLISSLHSTPNGPCDSACTNPSDLQSLQTWYNGFCSSGGTPANVQTTTSTSSPASTTSPTSTESTNIPTVTATSGSSTAAKTSSTQQGWFHNHWRWVVMLVVLVVVFTIIIILAIWLKKRHRAKRAASRAPTPIPFLKEKPSNMSLGPGGSGRTGTMQTLRSMGNGSDGNRTRTGTMQSRRGDLREMWGPHQHMAATRGWEYTDNGLVAHDPIEPVDDPRMTGGLAGGKSQSRSGMKEIDANVASSRPDPATADTEEKHSGKRRHRRSSHGGGGSHKHMHRGEKDIERDAARSYRERSPSRR